MKELQPINQNVLLELKEDNAEQKTASGIIIPDSAQEKQEVATVVAISNIENAEIAPGDEVLYKKFSGTEIDFDCELDRLHEALFSEIHDKRNPLKTRESIEEFLASQGVDVDKFRAAMDSFAVAAKTNRATALLRRYGIRAVPKLVVDGRYRFERPVRHKEMPLLAEQLAEEIREARKEDAR